MADVAVSTERYPQDARLAAANFSNQFETPVLFFALIMIAMEVGATGFLMTLLAWAFVATRVAHTLIHTGSNDLRLRASVFGARRARAAGDVDPGGRVDRLTPVGLIPMMRRGALSIAPFLCSQRGHPIES